MTENDPKLGRDQLHALQNIMKTIESEAGGCFFLHAPGGTAETFPLNLLLAKMYQRN
jgi:hypothetical protein